MAMPPPFSLLTFCAASFVCRMLVSPRYGSCLGLRRYHSSNAIHPRIITPPITPPAIPPFAPDDNPLEADSVGDGISLVFVLVTADYSYKIPRGHTLVDSVLVGLDKSVGNVILQSAHPLSTLTQKYQDPTHNPPDPATRSQPTISPILLQV
jgi:hypothetical protein